MSQAKDNYTKSLSRDSKDREFQQLYKSIIYIEELEQSIEELFRALSHAMCMTENNLAGMENALDIYNKYKDEYKTKSIKDLASPELIKQAEKFTEMIKDGTIKNRHHTIYQEKTLSGSILAFYKSVTGKTDATYKDITTEFANLTEEDMENTTLGGGHRVCEKCGATVFGSVECSCIYKDYSTVLERTSANKEVKWESPIDDLNKKEQKLQMTEEEAKIIIETIMGTAFAFVESDGICYIDRLRDKGYIIPVKSELEILVKKAEEILQKWDFTIYNTNAEINILKKAFQELIKEIERLKK